MFLVEDSKWNFQPFFDHLVRIMLIMTFENKKILYFVYKGLNELNNI